MHHRFIQPGLAAASVLRATPTPFPKRGGEAFCPGPRPRPLHDPHAAAERLADWSDAARLAGRTERADRLLLLAWEAYDRPASTPRRMGRAADRLAA